MTEPQSNLTQQAYRHIHRLLWRGDLTLGSKLPEVALANEIGVSRTPVREAVAQLENEGFLTQIPNKGSFVRMIPRDELDQLFDFRIHLECYALKLTMASDTRTLRDHLGRLCHRMFKIIRRYHRLRERNPNVDWQQFRGNWHLLDAAFHEQLLKSAQNCWVQQVSRQLHLTSRIFMPGRKIGDTTEILNQTVRVWREHRRIIQAIQRQDLEMGQRILRDHIEHGRRDVMAFMDWVQTHIKDKPAIRRKLPREQCQILDNLIHLQKIMQTPSEHKHDNTQTSSRSLST